MKKELSYLETIKAIDEVKKYFERQYILLNPKQFSQTLKRHTPNF